jgi:regulator of sigma E protease
MRWTNLTALLIIPGLLIIHELGHYLAARLTGIAAVEFAIGFGPRLAARQAFGTLWTLRAIPLGGYVRFAEEGSGALNEAPLSSRAKVMAAGPLANFAAALLLLWLLAVGLGLPWWQALRVAVEWFGFVVRFWVESVAALFAGTGLAELGGPVMMAGQAIAATAGGRLDLIEYTAKLSLNLGLFNLLPVPVLDGGRLMLYAVERLRGRRLQPETEAWILTGGALAMLALAALLIIKDVWRLVAGSVA